MLLFSVHLISASSVYDYMFKILNLIKFSPLTIVGIEAAAFEGTLDFLI